MNNSDSAIFSGTEELLKLLSGENIDGFGMATSGYYAMRCEEVTVYFVDRNNNYEITNTKTYPLEEYVAGVVAGEVAFLGSIEVDKDAVWELRRASMI